MNWFIVVIMVMMAGQPEPSMIAKEFNSAFDCQVQAGEMLTTLSKDPDVIGFTIVNKDSFCTAIPEPVKS